MQGSKYTYYLHQKHNLKIYLTSSTTRLKVSIIGVQWKEQKGPQRVQKWLENVELIT